MALYYRSLLRRASATPLAPKSGVNWGDFGFGLNLKNESKMVIVETTAESGFSENHKIDVVPYGPLSLEPSATILNYGQGIFEGIKAHRTSKGNITVFRPDQNAIRFANGANALTMPTPPMSLFLNACKAAVTENSHLVPPEGEGALYLRPILFGSGATLGLGPSTGYHFIIYVSPVGSYFKGVTGGARMKVEREHNRAAYKGCGSFKAGGNYAPCFKYQKLAKSQGFTDIIYLDNCEGKIAEEVACANLFLVQKDRIVTPSLGTILPGVTRNSVIQIAKDIKDEIGGREIVEGTVTQEDFAKAQEAFCTGTATVISPIEHIAENIEGTKFKYDYDPQVSPIEHIAENIEGPTKFKYDYDPQGPVLTHLKKTLVGIQEERLADKHGWVRNAFSDEFSKS